LSHILASLWFLKLNGRRHVCESSSAKSGGHVGWPEADEWPWPECARSGRLLRFETHERHHSTPSPNHVGTAQLRRLPICRNNFHLHKWGPLASFTRSDISAAAQLSLEWRSIDEQISGICGDGSVDRSFNARIGMLDPSEFNGFCIRLSAWRFNEQSVPGRVQTQGWAVVQLLTGDRV
jgi:hypothetical protein